MRELIRRLLARKSGGLSERQPARRLHAQATPLPPFSLQKFLNKAGRQAVFMIEGKRVVAGEAILSGAATIDSKAERSRVESRNNVLEMLVREHSRMVYRIAYAVLRTHHDAEDATQETFVRVLRYSSKLVEVIEPKTWLAKIAWRVAIDRSKQHVRSKEVSLEDPEKPCAEVPSPESAADDTLHGSQIEGILGKLIGTLPEKLRAPLILSTNEDMTPREVAATLGINEAAVRSRVFRARQMLKDKLSQRIGRK